MSFKPKKVAPLAVEGHCPHCNGELMEPLLTTPEAAAAIGMKPHTLDNFACQRRGPSFAKVGRCRLYSAQALRDFVQSRMRKCSAA